jgi:hypothetical protein
MNVSKNPAAKLIFIVFALVLACGVAADKDKEETTLAPPPEEGGFQLELGPFKLAAYTEALYCLKIPIPAPYSETEFVIAGIDSDLSVGTHHFFMAYSPEPLAKEEPCVGDSPLVPFENDLENSERPEHEGLSEGKLVFGAGVGEYSYRMPEGYGLAISGGGHFVTSHHVLNLTDNEVDIHGRFNIYTRPLDATPHPTNILNCDNRDIYVEPQSEVAITGTCTVPFDLDLVLLGSHAHEYLTLFETRIYDGKNTLDEVIYTNEQWDSPNIVVMDTPISLKRGMGITFTCHYRNHTDHPLTYGFGLYGEMCASMNAYAYPKDKTHEIPPSLGTIIFNRDRPVTLIDTTELEGIQF